MIKQIKLKVSNAYLVLEQRPILVDTGAPGDVERIVAALQSAGVGSADLSLIVHTHVHSDHVGSTAVLRQLYPRAQLAYHRGDQALMQQGHNGRLRGIGWRGWVMSRVFNQTPFPVFQPDFYLEDGLSLAPYGVNGRILHTPGHTAGSISILLADGQALVGDVLMGGYLGGAVRPRQPQYHYFAEDKAAVQQSVRILLTHAPGTWYVGHGGPLAAAVVARKFGHLIGDVTMMKKGVADNEL